MDMKKSTSVIATTTSLAALLLLAANLRPALTSVGPLLDQIRQATDISPSALGVLTSLPLLALGALAPLGHLQRRCGAERTVLAALALLVVGTLLRSQGSATSLFAGSVLLSAGIAIGNVLVPIIIRRDFHGRIHALTTACVVTMGLSAAIASGLAVPLAAWLPGGWRSSLAVWGLLALLAMALWLPAACKQPIQAAEDMQAGGKSTIWKSPVAWLVTAFMGSQSFFFYVVISWFPAVFQDQGATRAEAGWLVTVYQLVALGSSLLVPLMLRRIRSQGLVACVASAMLAGSALGLLLIPGLVYLWVVMMGFGGGICLVLALVFIGTRSSDPRQTAALSVMAQSLGYMLAATGPFLFSVLHDVSAGWTLPLSVLVILGLLQGAIGFEVGRERTRP